MSNDKTERASPISLLLVDDEEGFVSVLSKRLQKRNIDVTPALSGAKAIELFKKCQYDLVLLDIKMEFMDGIEVLKMMKEINPEVPVIMITGHGSLEEAQEGVSLGAVECLPKPYDFDDLVTKIFAVCKAEGGDNG